MPRFPKFRDRVSLSQRDRAGTEGQHVETPPQAPPKLTWSPKPSANPGQLSCALSPNQHAPRSPGPSAFFPSSQNEAHLSLGKSAQPFRSRLPDKRSPHTPLWGHTVLFCCPSLLPQSQNLRGVLMMPWRLFPEC